MVLINYNTGKIAAVLIFGVLIGFSFTYMFIVNPPSYYNPQRIGLHDHDSVDAVVLLQDDEDHGHALDNNTIAKQLFNEVKILCWIMTGPKQVKPKHILKTWGSRCNKLLFTSSAKDEEIETIALPVEEGRNHLWAKTKESFKHIYEKHLNEYDWFLKADDDTYVIIENLRFMLFPYSANTPIYFGCRFKPFVKQGYMSGAAGYVLSRDAVRRFVEDALPNEDKCKKGDDGNEDVEIGNCLEAVHVAVGDSRDSFGRGRFFPSTPEKHLIPGALQGSWCWEYIYYKNDEGIDGCSDNAISFHGVTPNQMYALDYLIYHLQPYGIVRNLQQLPQKRRDEYATVTEN